MTVVGTGVDLVEVSRFQQAVDRWGQRLLSRLFTDSELGYAQARQAMVQHLAARFAAKEAVVKALGAPKGLGLQWRDLEITRAPGGRPQATLSGSMRRWAELEVHLSLTHTARYAVATVLVCSP